MEKHEETECAADEEVLNVWDHVPLVGKNVGT